LLLAAVKSEGFCCRKHSCIRCW